MTILVVGEATKKSRPRNCPECKSTHLIQYREEEDCVVCMGCGLVISFKTAEHNSEENRNTVRRKHIHSIPCLDLPIPFSESKKTREKKSVQESTAFVLEKWRNIKISDSTEKNLALALFYITKTTVDLSLPKIALKKASVILKEITEKGLIKGRSIKALTAAVVYIACKECGFARSVNEIAAVSKVSTNEVGAIFRFLAKKLGLSVLPTRPSEYVLEISTKLTLSKETIKIANTISNASEETKLSSGKDPVGVAAAATYLSSLITGEQKTQREIAEVARVTETTIRNRCRELRDSLFFFETL